MSRIITPRRDLILPSKRRQRGSMILDAFRFGSGGSGGGADPYFANVKLLLNMGGASGATIFPDSAPSPHTITRIGNTQVDTSLGYNTAYFDGSGDYLSTPYVQTDYDWWTNDYTVEVWINPVTITSQYYTDSSFVGPALIGCANPTANTNYWSFGTVTSGAVRFYYYNGAPRNVTSASTIPASSLSHIAMTKTASGIYLATNGVVDAPVAIIGTPLSSTSGVVLTIGQIFNTSINSRVRAIRITKGVARYTSSFTPPSAPFPNS